MKVYTHLCICGSPLTAFVEKNVRVSGGQSVRFSHSLGCFTALRATVSGRCPVCSRRISHDFGNEELWSHFETVEQSEAAEGVG